MMNFREHALIKRFIHNGFTEEQAETITDGVIEIVSIHNKELATKQDIAEAKHDLERRMDKIDTNLNWIKTIGMVIIGLGIKMAFFN